ncbi:hypothetical protein EQ718_24080 (plasmid) [Paracoccus versutus]|uniref:Uncharacterized protein n=1 Tax=Paracoccus versutus TaxID=34007 RepID=A0AAQ0HGH8_PARVE|nr:hypothetical protein [Paracoccus versutus]REG45631.1 hypothetical protein ATH84_10202 [Paracoccus versutus]WEJ81881.1 hypothetical protein EQ718_24080 [Paracoccus versutus]
MQKTNKASTSAKPDEASISDAYVLRYEISELEREREARKLRVLSTEGVTSEPRDGRVIRTMLNRLYEAGLHGEAAAYVAHEIEARRFALRNLGEAA